MEEEDLSSSSKRSGSPIKGTDTPQKQPKIKIETAHLPTTDQEEVVEEEEICKGTSMLVEDLESPSDWSIKETDTSSTDGSQGPSIDCPIGESIDPPDPSDENPPIVESSNPPNRSIDGSVDVPPESSNDHDGAESPQSPYMLIHFMTDIDWSPERLDTAEQEKRDEHYKRLLGHCNIHENDDLDLTSVWCPSCTFKEGDVCKNCGQKTPPLNWNWPYDRHCNACGSDEHFTPFCKDETKLREHKEHVAAFCADRAKGIVHKRKRILLRDSDKFRKYFDLREARNRRKEKEKREKEKVNKE